MMIGDGAGSFMVRTQSLGPRDRGYLDCQLFNRKQIIISVTNMVIFVAFLGGQMNTNFAQFPAVTMIVSMGTALVPILVLVR